MCFVQCTAVNTGWLFDILEKVPEMVSFDSNIHITPNKKTLFIAYKNSVRETVDSTVIHNVTVQGFMGY